MRNKITTIDEQIREEERVKQKLRSENEAKLASIHSIEEKIAKEQETFFKQKNETLVLIAREKERSEDTLEDLGTELEALKNHVAGTDVIVVENEKLHSRVKELSREHAMLRSQWSEQINHMKQKSFDTRVKLEEVFRNTIKMFDKDSRKAAVVLMEEEALNAEIQNKVLLHALKNNEAMSVRLMKEQLRSAEALDKLKLEQEVVNTNISVQDEMLSKLEEVTANKTNRLQKLENDLESLQAQVDVYKEKCDIKEEMVNRLDAKTKEVQGKEKKLKDCKEQYINLAKSMMKDMVIMMDKDLHSVSNFERFLPYIDKPESTREEHLEENPSNEAFNHEMIWNSDYQRCTFMSGPLRAFLKTTKRKKEKLRNTGGSETSVGPKNSRTSSYL